MPELYAAIMQDMRRQRISTKQRMHVFPQFLRQIKNQPITRLYKLGQ